MSEREVEAPTMSSKELPITVSCGICGSDAFVVLYGPGVAQLNQIVRCEQCGLMYANPRKQADHVELEAQREEWDFAERNPQRFEKEQLQVRDYVLTRSVLGRLHPNRGKLVEVGSSCGFQLDAFRKEGWDVLGVEPDRNAAHYATQKLGIPIVNSILEDAQLPPESADAVMMLHVIEHVPDPVGTLREIFRVLKVGGHLVVETPRYDTLMYKVLGRRERSLSCDGHIFFFTTETLRRASTLAGFELERVEYVGRSLTLDRLVYNFGVMTKSRDAQRVLSTLSRRLSLHKLSITLNVRDMQRLYLRKPATRAGSDARRSGAVSTASS
jgi:2-polyprenyl-3-methyl-5-hydroxy-6-metoxy-1,4-benzoquinol methylase